jgi:hypothetical protein
MMMNECTQYLGDSVYAEVEDGMVKLTTNNGIGASNTIFMNADVVRELLDYIKRKRQEIQA